MAPVRSMKCIRRPPSRLPRVLVSLGRMISVISDWVLATVRAIGLVWMELILRLLHSLCRRQSALAARYNGAGGGRAGQRDWVRRFWQGLLFQFRQSQPNVQILHGR